MAPRLVVHANEQTLTYLAIACERMGLLCLMGEPDEDAAHFDWIERKKPPTPPSKQNKKGTVKAWKGTKPDKGTRYQISKPHTVRGKRGGTGPTPAEPPPTPPTPPPTPDRTSSTLIDTTPASAPLPPDLPGAAWSVRANILAGQGGNQAWAREAGALLDSATPGTAQRALLTALSSESGSRDALAWQVLGDAVEDEGGDPDLGMTARFRGMLLSNPDPAYWLDAGRVGDPQKRQPKPAARLRREFEQGADDLAHSIGAHPADRLQSLRGVIKDAHDEIAYRYSSDPEQAESYYPDLMTVYRVVSRQVPDIVPEEFANVVLNWRAEGAGNYPLNSVLAEGTGDGQVEFHAISREDYSGSSATPASLGAAIQANLTNHAPMYGRLVIRAPRGG